MGDVMNSLRHTSANQIPTWDNTRGMKFNIMLVYVGINKHGAKLYSDPLNRIAVKMDNINSPIDNVVWVNDKVTNTWQRMEGNMC